MDFFFLLWKIFQYEISVRNLHLHLPLSGFGFLNSKFHSFTTRVYRYYVLKKDPVLILRFQSLNLKELHLDLYIFIPPRFFAGIKNHASGKSKSRRLPHYVYLLFAFRRRLKNKIVEARF